MLQDLRKIGFMAGTVSLCGSALLSRDERAAICVSGSVLFNSAGYKGYFDLPRLMLFCAPRQTVMPETGLSGADIPSVMKNHGWKKSFDSFGHSGRAFPDYRVIRDLSLKFTDDPAVSARTQKDDCLQNGIYAAVRLLSDCRMQNFAFSLNA